MSHQLIIRAVSNGQACDAPAVVRAVYEEDLDPAHYIVSLEPGLEDGAIEECVTRSGPNVTPMLFNSPTFIEGVK